MESFTMNTSFTTYATLEEADLWHGQRRTALWPLAGETPDPATSDPATSDPATPDPATPDSALVAQKRAALVRATDWLNSRVRWVGRKVRWDQPHAWPRADVCLEGTRVSPDCVPPQVRDACCELAAHFMEGDALAPLPRGGRVLAESVDVLSVTYASDAPAETLFPLVEGLLRGLGVPAGVPTGVWEQPGGCVEVGRG